MVNPNQRPNPFDSTHREFVHRFSRRLCGICLGPVAVGDLDFDFIIPRHLGGPDALWNVRAAHAGCRERRTASFAP